MRIIRWKKSQARERRAFTLLEVLLATAIGVVLLAALYVAVDIQLRHAQIARDVVEESTLARALFARISGDIGQNLGPVLPAPPASAAAPAPITTATNAGNASSNSSATTPSTSSASTATTVASAGTGAFPINVGIQGDSNRLILTVTRYPRELGGNSLSATASSPIVSDLRRVGYWLAGSADAPLGLARREIAVVTSDDAAVQPQDLPDDPGLVIAPEVKSVQFSYFDGQAWQDSWDGTTAGADGTTPMGPPVAVAVILGIAAGATESPKSYRHVVFIPTANGTAQQPATTSAGS
jgi:prepilin-type N-terminal cleavage/methylation domain-containing protein